MALQLPPAPLRRCASSTDLRPPSPLQTRPMSPRITSLSSSPPSATSSTSTTTTITALSPSRAPRRHENTISASRLGTAPAPGRSPASSPRLPRAAPLQNKEEVVSFRLAQGLRPALASPSTPALATPSTPPHVRRRQRPGVLQAGANVDRAGGVACCEFELEPERERERDPPRPRLRRTSSLGDLEHAVVQWAEVSVPAYATGGGGGHWRLANDLPTPEAELDDELPLPPRTGFAAGRRQHVAAYLRRQHEALGGRGLAPGRPASGRPTSGRPRTAAAAAEMARRPQTVAHNLSSSPPIFHATTRPATTASASTSAELWLGPVGATPGSPSPPQRTPHPPAGGRSPNVSRRGNRRRAATDAPAVYQPGDLEGVLTATQQPTPGPPPPKPREILVREDPNTTMFNGVRSPPGVWRPATAATAHATSPPSPPAATLPGGRLPPLVRTTPELAGGLDDPGVNHAVEQLVASRAGSAVGRRRAQAAAADSQPPTQGHLVPPGRLAGPVQHSMGALPAGMRRTLLAGGPPEEHMSREEVLARLAAHMSRGGIVTPGVAPAAYRGLDQASDDEAEEGEDADRYGNADPAYMHMSRTLTRHARNISNNGDDELLAGASTAALTGLALEDTAETGSTWAAQPMALPSQPRPCDNCIPVRVGGGFLFVGFGDDHSRCLKCGRHLDTNLNDAHEKERLVASMEAMAPAQDDDSDAEHASRPVVEAVKRSARFRKPAAPKEDVPSPVKLKTQKASSNADVAPAPATTTDSDNSNDTQALPPHPLPPPAVADETTTAEATSPRSEGKMVIGKNAVVEDPYANLSLGEALALSKKMEDEGAATLGPKLRWKDDTYKGINSLATTREYPEPGSPPTVNPGGGGGGGGHRPAAEATTTVATPQHDGDGDALSGGDASDPTSASRGAAAPMAPGASPPPLDDRLRTTSHSDSTGPLVRETAGALSSSVVSGEEPQPSKASPPSSQGAPLRKGAAADVGPAATPQAAASNDSPTVQKKKRKALPTHQPTAEGVDVNMQGRGGDPARGQAYTKLGLLSDEESSEDEKEERAPTKVPKRKPKLLPTPMPAATTDPFADPRWQSKEERPLLDLLKELIDDDGSDAGLPLSDTISYLSKFCLLDAQKLSRYRRIFLESDRDQDNHLNMRELCQGLRSVTEDQITKREMDFVIRVLELADDTGLAKDRLKSRVTFRVFAVVAALSERVSGLDGDVKGLINSLNAKGLEARLKLAKHLFYVNDTSQQGSIELDQVEVELHAGNLSDEHRDDIMNTLHKEGMMSLTFLDYLAYIPLFLDIHDTIVDNPLDDSKRR